MKNSMKLLAVLLPALLLLLSCSAYAEDGETAAEKEGWLSIEDLEAQLGMEDE